MLLRQFSFSSSNFLMSSTLNLSPCILVSLFIVLLFVHSELLALVELVILKSVTDVLFALSSRLRSGELFFTRFLVSERKHFLCFFFTKNAWVLFFKSISSGVE